MVSGRFAQRLIRPMAVRLDWVESPDVNLSLFKTEKKEQAWKESNYTCGIQG